MNETQASSELLWSTDKNIDGEALMLGFAFSLEVDGSYGWYNELIGNKMVMDINRATGSEPWVGVQWEIYDAIASGPCSSCLQFIPRRHVVPPPSFTEEDIITPKELDLWLAKRENATGNRAIDVLRAALDATKQSLPGLSANPKEDEYKGWLAAWLNTLLGDDDLWREIAKTQIQVLDGVRSFRDTFVVTERRKMPDPNKALAPFQRRRVNRLMIDALCCVKGVSLRPMPYLSTQDVLDELLEKAENEGREIRRVRIYGNPVHVERCAKQFYQTACWRKWPISPSSIYIVLVTNDPSDRWTRAKRESWETNPNNWRQDTAQEWCRSLESWNAYNRELAEGR